MKTVDDNSTAFESTKVALEALFKNFDLEVEMTVVEVVESSADSIKLRAEQTTKKISGPEFKDNRITAVHTLKKRGDEWKIFATEIEKVEYL